MATPVVSDVHVPPGRLDDNVVVPFEHIVCVPLKFPADGGVVTVIVTADEVA